MVPKEATVDRPDGILLVIAFLLTVGVGLLLVGIFLLATALPAQFQMAAGDSLFLSAVVVLLVMTVLLLATGGWLLIVCARLWRARPNSRAWAVVATAVLAIAALLSVPAFYMTYGGGSLLTATVGGALLVAAGGAASFWYLTRPHIKGYLG